MNRPPPRPRDSDADRLLATLAAGGDREEIFRRLHDRYRRPVRACFARRGVGAEDCEDLTQETFLRLCRGIDGFRRQSRFETWLYEIVNNVWRNYLRYRKAPMRDGQEVPLEPGEIDPSLVPSADPDQLRRVLGEERAALLRQELGKMPPQMRRCLELRLDQGLKYREISVLMQISVDAVKSHLGQAKRRIRDRLGDYFAPGYE